MDQKKPPHDPVFQKEYDQLESFRLAIASGDGASQGDVRAFIQGYQRLLRQAEKMVRIGDRLQNKLVRAREEIQTKNNNLIKAQKALIRKEKAQAMNTLIAGIAHELLNPLNFINNLSTMQVELAEELQAVVLSSTVEATRREQLETDLSDLVEGARIIWEQGERAQKIVGRMNDFGRDDTEEARKTDVKMLVQSCIHPIQENFKNRHPQIEVHLQLCLPEDLAEILLTPSDLGFALTQIMTNAYEAVIERALAEPEHQPKISLTVTCDPEKLVVQVCDNGVGIPSEQHDNLFTPFHTTKSTQDGYVGLGLYSSQDLLMNGDGGHLEFLADQECTTFQITLPLEEEKSPDDTQD